MKTRRFLMGALALAMVAATIVGCKKEQENDANGKQTSNTEMLRFQDAEELFAYMDDAEANNQRGGFVSFGKMADDAYYSINPEEMFENMDEVIQFVLEHKDLFQLILGSDGEYTVETRYFNHPFRDVANTDGIFQVGDKSYRIIENGLVYTSMDNTECLKRYKDNGCRENTDNLCFYSFNQNRGTYVCSDTDLYNEKTVDNNRITLRIENYATGPFNVDKYLYGYTYLAKPYHYSLGWWGCNRTIIGVASVGLSKVGLNMNYASIEKEERTTKGFKLKFNKVYENLLEPLWYITYANCTAQTYDVGTVRVHCY